MFVSTPLEKVIFSEYDLRDPGAGETTHQDFYEWEEYIASKGYVLMPMVERGGACIIVDIGGGEGEMLGCLIKYPDLDTQLNFVTGKYQALVKEDNSIAQVFFKDVMDCIVPVGTVMYLDMGVIQDERFAHPLRKGKYLHTRLNVPNIMEPEQGKVYVTGMYKRNKTRTQLASSSSVTFAVNPWDITPQALFKGDTESIVKYLD